MLTFGEQITECWCQIACGKMEVFTLPGCSLHKKQALSSGYPTGVVFADDCISIFIRSASRKEGTLIQTTTWYN